MNQAVGGEPFESRVHDQCPTPLTICPPRSGTSVGGLPSEGAEHWRGWGAGPALRAGTPDTHGRPAGEGPRPHLSLGLETMDGMNQKHP